MVIAGFYLCSHDDIPTIRISFRGAHVVIDENVGDLYLTLKYIGMSEYQNFVTVLDKQYTASTQ